MGGIVTSDSQINDVANQRIIDAEDFEGYYFNILFFYLIFL